MISISDEKIRTKISNSELGLPTVPIPAAHPKAKPKSGPASGQRHLPLEFVESKKTVMDTIRRSNDRHLKPLSVIDALEHRTGIIRLPAIRISKINRRRHHIIAHNPRQLRRQDLSIHWRARLDHQFIHSPPILHDPTILDISMIDNFVTFLWRRHER
jgi:hypothetical protein